MRSVVLCDPSVPMLLAASGVLDRTEVWCDKEENVDDRQFDDMTRAVGMQSARRGMLKAAVGGALGLVGLSALTDRALAEDVVDEAKKCKKNNDCPKNKVCVSKKCVECKNDKQCSKNDKCKKNKCVKK